MFSSKVLSQFQNHKKKKKKKEKKKKKQRWEKTQGKVPFTLCLFAF